MVVSDDETESIDVCGLIMMMIIDRERKEKKNCAGCALSLKRMIKYSSVFCFVCGGEGGEERERVDAKASEGRMGRHRTRMHARPFLSCVGRSSIRQERNIKDERRPPLVLSQRKRKESRATFSPFFYFYFTYQYPPGGGTTYSVQV